MTFSKRQEMCFSKAAIKDCFHLTSLAYCFVGRQPTSFPGSFILGKKDPGSGWSRGSQKVGGDKKTAGGRSEQVAILSFLNLLWKGKICLKM